MMDFHHIMMQIHHKLYDSYKLYYCPVSDHGSLCCWPCWSGGPLGLVVGPWVWWASGSGGFCGELTDKSPTLRGPACQGVLGLVFHRFPGTSIRPQYMPVKRAEFFPFRDFFLDIELR